MEVGRICWSIQQGNGALFWATYEVGYLGSVISVGKIWGKLVETWSESHDGVLQVIQPWILGGKHSLSQRAKISMDLEFTIASFVYHIGGIVKWY
jgi:hypothetical protein